MDSTPKPWSSSSRTAISTSASRLSLTRRPRPPARGSPWRWRSFRWIAFRWIALGRVIQGTRLLGCRQRRGRLHGRIPELALELRALVGEQKHEARHRAELLGIEKLDVVVLGVVLGVHSAEQETRRDVVLDEGPLIRALHVLIHVIGIQLDTELRGDLFQ